MKIYFSGARIGEKRLLSRVLDYAVENLRQPERLSLSLSFLDEEKMRALNKETRGADKPTDVLSFQYLDYIKAGERVELDRKEYFDVVTGLVDLGEIYICRSIARRQAKEYGHSVKREKAFLALHGLLHLLGYDHDGGEDEREMFAIQENFLDALDLKRS